MSTPIKPVEGGEEPSDNLSYAEFIAQRQRQTPEEPTEEPATEEPEEVEEIEAEESEEIETDTDEETESEAEETPQDFDLESLTPEQIRELAQKSKSRLLKDLGRFKGEAKVLRQELDALKQQQAKPLPNAIPANQIPEAFRSLQSLDEIAAKHAEMEKVAEDTDRILDDHEGYGPDDVIELDGKEFTKRQIKQANRNARDAMTKFLPAMHREIALGEHLKAIEQQAQAAIPSEVPEVGDEESPAGKLFKQYVSDPIVDQFAKVVPDIRLILAHAARSKALGSSFKSKAAAGTTPKAKVPESPLGAAAARTGVKPAAKAKEAARLKFERTGRAEDWEAWKAL